MSYNAFKVIHVAGVIVFLGNIIVTGVWKVLADRTGEPRVIAYAQRLVTITDWVFTAGGVVLILIGAYGMASVGGLDLRQAWLVWGQSLFGASGLIWVVVLIPTQIAQARQARVFAAGGVIPESYWRYGRRWALWGRSDNHPARQPLFHGVQAVTIPSPASGGGEGRVRPRLRSGTETCGGGIATPGCGRRPRWARAAHSRGPTPSR
jgi:uncharacterized membrane protein